MHCTMMLQWPLLSQSFTYKIPSCGQNSAVTFLSPFPLLFLLVSLFFPSFSSPSFALHPLTSYLSSPCSLLSSGVAGPAAPGAFSCLQLSLCCLPVGRHQEGAAGSCETWGAGKVSALITSLIPIFHFHIHRAHSLRLQVSEWDCGLCQRIQRAHGVTFPEPTVSFPNHKSHHCCSCNIQLQECQAHWPIIEQYEILFTDWFTQLTLYVAQMLQKDCNPHFYVLRMTTVI